MITFSRLGKMGRFGNQLFQIAATLGIAHLSHQQCLFPSWAHSPFFASVLPTADGPLVPEFTVIHEAFKFAPIALMSAPHCVIDLKGYFQSEQYFLNCEKDVRQYFRPAPLIQSRVNELYGSLLTHEKTCLIHVRHGDYALYPEKHPILPRRFYTEAIDLFSPDTLFMVTSDDIEWCYSNIKAKHLIYLPQSGMSDWIVNFFLGVSCQDAIIANSTFSWWIAWLNENTTKQVIAPKLWFGPAFEELTTSDLLPRDWIII